MPTKPARIAARPRTNVPAGNASAEDVQAVLVRLQDLAQVKVRDEMGPRYGIHTDKAFGVMMRDMQRVAKDIGRDHAFALLLWDAGWYEARMVACMVDDPAQLTATQMDRWCADFDNWGICDTVCFKLFDQVPHAPAKALQWAKRGTEMEKRAGFALMACLALHAKEVDEAYFFGCLPLIRTGAADDRNFVKKGVSWALRSIALRSKSLRTAAIGLAEELAASKDPAERWCGKDVLRGIRK